MAVTCARLRAQQRPHARRIRQHFAQIGERAAALRRASLELRPLLRDEFVLAAAATSLIGQLQSDEGVTSSTATAGELADNSAEPATSACSSEQQAIGNANRHGHAAPITVRFGAVDGQLT
ncbi:MAG: hypothetical protein WBN32_13810 [Woeseia sp.]